MYKPKGNITLCLDPSLSQQKRSTDMLHIKTGKLILLVDFRSTFFLRVGNLTLFQNCKRFVLHSTVFQCLLLLAAPRLTTKKSGCHNGTSRLRIKVACRGNVGEKITFLRFRSSIIFPL